MKSFLLLLAFCSSLAAQTVDGDVVDALTGVPIEGAYIFAPALAGGLPISARTDASGHFRLDGVSRSASLRVLRTGYRFADWSLPQPASPQSSQDVTGIRIRLVPGAVISGTVTDEDGFPVERALVQALCYRLVNGQQKLQRPDSMGAFTQSDDLGQFRLTDLPAGRYRIQTTPGELINWDRRYVPLFFPGGLQPADTDLFEVKTGQELSGVELRLTKYEGVSVAGRLLTPEGAPPRGHALVSLTQSGISYSSYGGFQRGDGGFSIPHVPPGNYVLRAQSGDYPPKTGDFVVQQPLQVGQSDVAGIVLTLREVQAVDLPGTVALEGGGKLRPMLIEARTGMGQSVTARSDDAGSFVLKGLLPGHYRLQVRPELRAVNGEADPVSAGPAGIPVSALLGEKEVLREGFDVEGPPPGPLRITLGSHRDDSPRITAIGTLLDAAGQPLAGARLMLLSSGPPAAQIWAETDAKGRFSVSSSVPGEFRVLVAPDRSQTELLSDLDFIEAHKQDYPPLRLVEGQNPPFTLRTPLGAR